MAEAPTGRKENSSLGASLGHLISPLTFVIIVSILARLVPALYFGAEVADLTTYRRMANIVLDGQNIYETHNLFPYTPLSMFVPALLLRIAEWLQWPFHLVMKLPTIAADAAIATLLYLGVRRASNSRTWGILAGLAYGLNPVSILVTGFHGNLMPIAAFLYLWAYYLLACGQPAQTYRLSAWLLGLSIGFRSFPILLLPFFLARLPLGLQQKSIFAAIAVAPAALTLAPFMAVTPGDVWREAFSYSGTTDFGWGGIARAYWYIKTGSIWLPGTMGEDLPNLSKYIFFIAYGLLLVGAFILRNRLTLITYLILSLVAFYVFYANVAAQYMVWVLPLAILVLDRMAIPYSLFAAGALVAFYAFFHPGILFGPRLPWIYATQQQLMATELAFLTLLWLTCIIWMVSQLLGKGNLLGKRLL